MKKIINIIKKIKHGASGETPNIHNIQSTQSSSKEAELLALQNQINPHFLYNVLDSIRGEALKEGSYHIADITEALSTYFRYTITETKSLVTLVEELENVENYFKIQQYRFGNKLQLKIDLHGGDETLSNLKCPKLLLQPIVENSIFHGIEKKVDGGHVIIEVQEFTDKIEIWVRDNGVGMTEERLEQINDRLYKYIYETDKNRKHGIALHNVSRRIKLLFGEEYGLHIFSIQNIGTNICIVLPKLKEG